MDWYFFTYIDWDIQPVVSADIWLWPVKGKIEGNMGDKINLTITALEVLLRHGDSKERKLARRLAMTDKAWWIWPYLVAEQWRGDDVSMIVRGKSLPLAAVPTYARVYLEAQGHSIQDISLASWEQAMR